MVKLMTTEIEKDERSDDEEEGDKDIDEDEDGNEIAANRDYEHQR